MNYHYIINKYETIEYPYNDTFDISIYYLDDNLCEIVVKRTDSSSGWGLLLEIKIYDINENDKYEIINFGSSNDNIISRIFSTNIFLEPNKNKIPNIPSIVNPRKEQLILNKYELKNITILDLHFVIYKLDQNKIKIIIRRLDDENGWDNDIILYLYDVNIDNRKEIIHIGNSKNNYKYMVVNTKIDIIDVKPYKQEIPFYIIQTGHDNSFKNILHFNSIMSFIELNPEYTYLYYSDKDGRKLLRESFNNEINYAYDMLVPGAYKADLFRYCILQHIGGCYFDCKQILRVPIHSFLDKNKTFVLCNDVIDNALLNAIIFSTKSNDIIAKAIKDCVYNVIHKLGKTPLDVTGPTFLYKSIKKFINSNNLILQNNRPPDNFSDFSKDYVNNNITLISNKKVIINRFYKEYYNNYLNNNHYGKLFDNNEIYYKNFQNINNLRLCIYPNKYNDKFNFILKDNNLLIKRTDSNEGWSFNLKINIILNTGDEHIVSIGSSKINKKEIKLDFM